MDAVFGAGGECATPYSKFVDRRQVAEDWKARPASPSTVTNVAVLPLGQTKKNIKSFLREKLFPPNHDIRSVLFKNLVNRISHNSSMFSQQMFYDFVEQCYPKVTYLNDAPIPSFVAEETKIPYYFLNEEGKLQLRKILVCIDHHFPHVTFCPILPPIASLFLHYDDSPSQVFSHVCHLLFCSLKHVQYLDQNKMETEASARVLGELVRRFAPTSHKTLTSFTSNPDEIYSQWLQVLFHGLPFSYLVILFDMYLIEGYKALFRAAISVLKFYRKVGLSNPSDILSAVFKFVSKIDKKVSAALLFKKAYSIKLPSTKEIRKMHYKQLGVLRYLPFNDSDAMPQERAPWRYIYFVRNVVSDIIDEELFSKLYCWLPERISLLRPSLLFSTAKHGYSMDALFRGAGERTPTILLIKTSGGHTIGAYLASDLSERHSTPNSYFGTGETFIFSLSPLRKKWGWVGLREADASGSKDNTFSNDDRNSLTSSVASGMKSLPPVGARSSRGFTLPPIFHDAALPSLVSTNRDARENSVVLPPIVNSPVSQKSSPSVSLSNIIESSSLAKVQHKISNERGKTSSELFMYTDSRGISIGGGNGYGLFLDISFLNCTTEHCDTFDNMPLVPGKNFQCVHVELFGFTE